MMEASYLWEKLGPKIQRGLQNHDVFEIMLNPDQKIWFKYRQAGNLYEGTMDEAEAKAFVHALADYQGKYLNRRLPYLDTTLPFNGERVNVVIPPITEKVSFNIRKKSKHVFSLEDYEQLKIITPKQARLLSQCVRDRKNILISGSPASGKTTLANALLTVVAKHSAMGDRVLILEQVPELQCSVKNVKKLLVSESVSMNHLLWLAMRNSPDRIVVGEVRDGSALDMLKAWNTGCPGGIATVHANHAKAAVQRILDLACEVVVTPPYALAAEVLDVIVQIEERAGHPAGRCVTEVVAVTSFDSVTQQFQFQQLDQ